MENKSAWEIVKEYSAKAKDWVVIAAGKIKAAAIWTKDKAIAIWSKMLALYVSAKK